ncbi:MAG: hypothetical protein IKG11_09020 [Atopobiaceae bacterium]|nr:hypothetical protein [Atopobiaceae bacterium]
MIKDSMIEEIQELKLAGYTVGEAYDTLKTRHSKVPTLKTVRKYYNMDHVPEDNHAKVRKHAAFDVEPLASAIVEIVERNPGCYMSSVYDVLVERFVESGEMEALPGNEQTLRNYIRRLHEEGRISEPEAARRKYDVLDIRSPAAWPRSTSGSRTAGAGWSSTSCACCCGTRACSGSTPRTTGSTRRRRAEPCTASAASAVGACAPT